MRYFRYAAFLAGALAASPLFAVDYDQVDRSLTKEPKYQSGKPEYALLLFGMEAKRRAWVVVDGDVVYLDRNGDGDLTAADERFEKTDNCKDIEVADPDDKTRYVITRLNVHRDKVGNDPASLMANVTIHGDSEYKQYCDAQLGVNANEAAIAHFGGPLTIGPRTINWKVPPETKLTPGEKPADLYVMVGTMSDRHHCWVVVVSHEGQTHCSFPDGVRPLVTVEFSPREPGGAAVTKEYRLDAFC